MKFNLKTMLFPMKKKLILMLIALAFIIGIYLYDNSGLEGVYTCRILDDPNTNDANYLVFQNSKSYSIYEHLGEFHVSNGSPYIIKNGDYFFHVYDEILDQEYHKINVNFRSLEWPYYKGLYKRQEKPIPKNDLQRIYNPVLKHKIYSAIRAKKDKTLIDSLWQRN